MRKSAPFVDFGSVSGEAFNKSQPDIPFSSSVVLLLSSFFFFFLLPFLAVGTLRIN